ncbi:MAG: DNA polymerase III subunit chi [Gammaproteobacteria bacterium]|nr:DNA polymerase III subunit chi [Gammaproteobacteria bacterium]MBT8151813.1 DNA polymerase III subunit chi [Gammaproteobacteria bacterium]NNL10896.1 DNA polymerase III subunit chi [Pseudomonadales bacterium]NNM10563.1 DNA polymerase III subunit chi [Pseudomonadales bacterium]
MTRVDFYIAGAGGERDWLNVACRVIEKAWRREHDIYVHTDNAEAMAQFDNLLWSFRPNSFIPHRNEAVQAAAGTPREVLIGCSGQPGDHHDVLINLTHSKPDFFGRFTRIAEIVPGDEQARRRSRERYKYYRERGYPLHVHDL